MSFEPEEIERIEDANLILLGVAPSEIARMSLQQRADVLAMAQANEALRNGKLPEFQ